MFAAEVRLESTALYPPVKRLLAFRYGRLTLPIRQPGQISMSIHTMGRFSTSTSMGMGLLTSARAGL